VQTLSRKLASAKGQRQLLQAGGAISAIQVDQLQKLRQLTAAQIQLLSAHHGGQVDRQVEEDAIRQWALQPHDPPFPRKLKTNLELLQ